MLGIEFQRAVEQPLSSGNIPRLLGPLGLHHEVIGRFARIKNRRRALLRRGGTRGREESGGPPGIVGVSSSTVQLASRQVKATGISRRMGEGISGRVRSLGAMFDYRRLRAGMQMVSARRGVRGF